MNQIKLYEPKRSFLSRIFNHQTYLQMPTLNVVIHPAELEKSRVEVDATLIDIVKNPMDDHLVTDKPYYQPVQNEVELFSVANKEKLPFMLKGPTGCGKTRFVEYMAHQLEKPLITVSCQEDLSASDLVGRFHLNQQGSYWQDGPLTKAARHGGICYLDEIVEARNDAMVLIHSLTDHRRVLPIDKTGETIKAHPDFMLVISYNPHYQSALKEMKQSTRQRFIAKDFDYPGRELEEKIIADESGVSKQVAEGLVNLGGKIRSMKGTKLSEGASTRLLSYAARLMNSGMDKYHAIESAIASPLTDEEDVKSIIMTLARDTI